MLVLVFQIFVIRAQGSSKAWLLSWVKCSVSAFSTILITRFCLCFKSLWPGRKEAGGSVCNDGSGRWWASGVTQSLIIQSPTIYHQNQSPTNQLSRSPRNIAKGTTDPRHRVLWHIQHLQFKAEASRNFWNLGQTSVWFCSAKGEKQL